MTRWHLTRAFPQRTLAAIEHAIETAEHAHGGEIRFALERELSVGDLWRNVSPRERAIELFGQLGVWDTADNNGVLVYVLLADHDVEIVADRGFAQRVTPEEWSEVCQSIEQAYRAGDFERGTLEGIANVSKLIARHYPVSDHNEQPNRPIVL